jgi:23S rRNA pseudoU1915 N3-methylase RlmH
MKIALLQTGKPTDKHIAGAVDLYASRIKNYSKLEIKNLSSGSEDRRGLEDYSVDKQR